LCYTTTRDRGADRTLEERLTEEERRGRHIGVGGSPCGLSYIIYIYH